LDYKRLGPFRILEKIGTVAYRLDLPPSFRIHNVFHASLLEPAQLNTIPSRKIPTLEPIEVNGQQEFEVQDILDSRLVHRQGQYLVHWQGFPISDSTWEPAIHLEHSQDLIKNFHAQYPTKPGPFPAPRPSVAKRSRRSP
jgi:hypothetical protein